MRYLGNRFMWYDNLTGNNVTGLPQGAHLSRQLNVNKNPVSFKVLLGTIAAKQGKKVIKK